MKTTFVEATQAAEGGFNWGKFLVGTFTRDEWEYTSRLPAAGNHSLLYGRGWSENHVLVFDLQTGEGAMFAPGGMPSADLDKHKVWVCPMYEPFLAWLYAFVGDHPDDWQEKLPPLVELPDAPAAMFGYRREGVET